jgi:predicted RNA-binding Zn-ribbon protein involved in translation (DUF1610 family)
MALRAVDGVLWYVLGNLALLASVFWLTYDFAVGTLILFLSLVILGGPLCTDVAATLRARRARKRGHRWLAQNRCPTCGYSLRGLPGNRCPECGGEFPARAGWSGR